MPLTLERKARLLQKTNQTEQAIVEEYQRAGYGVIARGWPDLLVFNDNEIFAVEVKRKPRRRNNRVDVGLSVYQKQVHQLLKRCGLKVIVRYQERPQPIAEVVESMSGMEG